MEQYRSFFVTNIRVDEKNRQRHELDQEHISALADSIERVGLLHPPCINSDGTLISGEHRFEAMKLLGWTEIPVLFMEDLDESQRVAIALEENIKRHDITWQEECRIVAHYHELHRGKEGWNHEKTGAGLGISASYVSRMLSVASELNDPTIAACATMSSALTIVQRNRSRESAAEADEITASFDFRPDIPAAPVAETKRETDCPIKHTDFFDWLDSYNGRPFNLIHCDFPYGIDFHKSAGQSKSNKKRYDDTVSVLDELVKALPEIPTSPSAHLIFWFSPTYYEVIKLRLIKQGWKVDPFPLIWMKSDNSGILPDRHRGGRRIYEMAFFAAKGDRNIVRPVANAFAAPQPKNGHPSEKHIDVMRHFLSMVVDKHTHMIDPTCGSGNSVFAAYELGASRVLGLEKDDDFMAQTKAKWDMMLED